MEIYLIGNSHIDPVWLWRWPEGMQVVRSTCEGVLKLMKCNPEIKFSFSSTIFYKWIKETAPHLFTEIQQYVKEGRWELVGGWIVEPDCNIPCGESFVRHSLYGQLFLKDNFGRIAEVGYNPDTFGHNASLPQILSKSGMKFYVFMRPGPNEKTLPSSLFCWKSKDGSSVIAYRIPISYCTGKEDLKSSIESFLKELEGKLEKAMFLYGAGDHGGGPTEENIKSLRKISKEMTNHNFIFATTQEFFEKVQQGKYPVIEDELQYHSRGCYTSCSLIKSLNRKGENSLLSAEKFAVMSHLLVKKPYPRQKFCEAWERLLFSQFHDILAGTSIHPAYEDAQYNIGFSISTAEEITHFSLQSISEKIKTEEPSLIVFNPSSWERTEPVEIELKWEAKSLSLLSPHGETIKSQEIQAFNSVGIGIRRFLSIVSVPPLGYSIYKLIPSQEHITSSPKLENEFFILEIDKNGYISLLLDKLNSMEPLRYPALVPLVIDDQGDAWAHGINSFRSIIGQFKSIEQKWIETGPLMWKYRVKSIYGDSILWQDFILYKGHPFIDVQANLLWREKHKMLKISLPTIWNDSIATFSIPYGFIVREQNGEEQPLFQWMNIDKEDGSYGVAFINDSKYGGDVFAGEMRLSIVRSPVYAHHIPYKLEEGKDYLYIDQGFQRFSYRIYPHKGNWKEAKVVQKAEEFNVPLQCMIEHNHNGFLPPSSSILEIFPSNVLLSAFKLGEKGESIIFRIWETEGKECTVKLKLMYPPTEWEGIMAPSEIKTLKLKLCSLEWKETNLLEE